MPAPGLRTLLPEASPELQGMLDAAGGPPAPPIRAEIFGQERFRQHGRSLGETHRAARAARGAVSFFPRLRSNIGMLRLAHRYIGLQAATGYDVSPAAEWLLDNFHVIEAQFTAIHDGLPRSYYRDLPVLQDEPLAGLPRVYGVAWAFVAHTDSAFDEDLLVQFLCAYQDSRELQLSEMWALPTTLRVVLIENLRRLAERVAANKAAREAANLCCERLAAGRPTAPAALLALLEGRGMGRMFLSQLALRLQDHRSTDDLSHREWLGRMLPDLAAVQAQQSADQAADNLSVSNAVISLRAIGDADWPEIVARASALMRLMRGSPLFEAEHVATRDRTLHGIEQLARRSGRSELAVAHALLDQMHCAEGAPAVASHWLQGPGRSALAASLGLHEGTTRTARAIGRRLALPAYLGALALGTLGLSAWLLHAAQAVPGVPGWLAGLGAVLALLPASEAVVAVLNRLVSESVRPCHLPRLALAQGIPAEHRVLVVIPALLTGSAAVKQMVHRLLLHHLANPERHAQFALLSDWMDADAAQAPSDTALLAEAMQQIRELNVRHPVAAGPPRFLLLHRERRFSATEQRWIGWERKRGKLESLVAALANGSSDAFLDLGEISRLAPDTPYLVTLDSDTQLPPGRLRELVGVAAHPQNQPQWGAALGRVVAGYGILQPRVVTPLPAPRELTLYHWLFAGQCGIDPYSVATSEVYQDLFGEGSYSGKGLLHVAAMQAVLAGRLPEDRVLSHDLLEGSLARCAALSDITVIEEAPFHADVAASRVHRWMRGDWQLLPFLLQPRRYRLRAINRWKMFDNLRRSLVAPASLALLALALGGSGVSLWGALALVLAACAAGPLLGAGAAFSPSRDDLALRHFYRQAAAGLVRAAAGGLWLLAQLLAHALWAADAIGRALYRLAWSRRHLLQWTTAAAAQAQAAGGLAAVARRHWRITVAALGLLAVLFAAGTPWPGLATALCLVWAASPLWTWWVSRTRPAHRDAALAAADRAYLLDVARDTWRFFERCVVAADHHLPPDNLQVIPHDIVAHRTSPTNIGLYLLSVACARQFGWIDAAEMLARLEATLATLGGLQRHRGHFLNWYDTQTCAPLLPMYVSTVDSGNLCGHLLAVAQACRELAAAPGQAAARLHAVAARCESLAWGADFGFLYHRKRRLLHIGYRLAEQQLDAGFYDLLASESRLTSLVAIAKGDVPVNHWAALGRPLYAVGTQVGLRSWSGSMFEYLMPTLVLDEPQGSVLHEAGRAALREQMAFGRARGVPWGISECAHAGRDHTLTYQYAPQGVPRLALRRTPPDELVVAPYATALAAQVAPHHAVVNLRELQQRTARGALGFIEALDYTPARQVDDQAVTRVGTFMSHHQGMSLVALANVLLGGVAQRWGMANASIEAVASLLHERVPREVSRLYEPFAGPLPPPPQRRASGLLRDVVPGLAAVAPTHVLSNGRYTVTLRPNGAGWSRCGTSGITRWRDDALRDAFGSFFYLRRSTQPRLVSITQHPAPDPAAHYHSTFHADRVCFGATWPGMQAHVTVWVSPEDDVEFRQVELRNLGEDVLEVELISAFEVTLGDPRADEAHPAFANLFVQAQWRAAHQALVFERTPRLATEPGLLAAHGLAATDPQVVSVAGQTDRQRWLGRNQGASQPQASLDLLPSQAGLTAAGGGPGPSSSGGPLGEAALRLDTGLDPVCALAVRLRIAPGGKAQLTFATAASLQREVLHAVIDKYRQPSHVERASLMSATLAGIRLGGLRLSVEDLAALQTLTTALVLSLARPQARPAGVCDRRLLWRFGLSGERPLILVSAGSMTGLGLLRSLAEALRLWSWGGIACDLVMVNAEPPSYQMDLQRELVALRERHAAEAAVQGVPVATALHVLPAADLSASDWSTLEAVARVRLVADGRPLVQHVQGWIALHEQALDHRLATSGVALPVAPGPLAAVPAPAGRFAPQAGEFHFEVGAALRPVRPWINVLSNPAFGAQISEAGGGYTWARNSRMNQLTAWSNDPVCDAPAEWFLLQDGKTLETWSVAPSAWGDARLVYQVSHGQGHTVISHRRGDLEVSATWAVDAQASVKQVALRLVNRGRRTLHLRVVGIAEWMMGASRADRSTVHTALFRQRLPALPGRAGEHAQERKLTALLGTQQERSAGFGDGTAFLGVSDAAHADEDWTCDRCECFDARGALVLPDHFGQRSGGGLDPCAALSLRVRLGAGEAAEPVFLLGYADTPDAARQLATVAAALPAAQRLAHVRSTWDRLLHTTTVVTPDPLFDVLVNRWLLYQTVSCRLWAKAGFYQAGGATGFRDQLQDTLALAWAAPQLLREQIVLCASRQFPEGDVQHWWHAPTGAGVRTHFSDDLLWLVHACVHYLRATGDTALLDEPVPFIEGAAIPAGAEDLYDTPRASTLVATVYEHAARAIDRSLRLGGHGLPLMGTGDWNDGMNRVGHEGRGESVWLAWFLCRLVHDFAPWAHERGDVARARRWETAALGWQAALQGPAWDGQWFKRAFFDNGEALGSQHNAEARIDLIAQAWAVLSGAAPRDLQGLALAAVEAHLVDEPAGLIRLLDPPLRHAVPSAGYIQAYPPGVRENGGQYSHAGVWALMARAEHARGAGDDLVWRDFTWLSPAHRAVDPVHGAAYGLEPYVMAGDVYSQPPYVGRGGWSWYTGAAAWLHRAALESIFGLRLDARELSFVPCLPSHWPRAELTLVRDGRTMRFILLRGRAAPAVAADLGAQLLRPGQALRWDGLGPMSCFVVALEPGR